MKKEIIRMAITNIETGETEIGGYYPICLNLSMSTIAKIIISDGFTHPDQTLQVIVECKALDSSGSVFDLHINYNPKSKELQDSLLKTFKEDSIFIFEGDYGIIKDEPACMFDPEFRPVRNEYDEYDVRKAFNVNGQEWLNKG